MDLAVARLAAGQEAMVSTAQMRELGITDRAVEVRARRGGLHRVHQGVYIVGVRRMTPIAFASRCQLAGGVSSIIV